MYILDEDKILYYVLSTPFDFNSKAQFFPGKPPEEYLDKIRAEYQKTLPRTRLRKLWEDAKIYFNF
jgi:hypothetical protein